MIYNHVSFFYTVNPYIKDDILNDIRNVYKNYDKIDEVIKCNNLSLNLYL